MKFFSIIFHIAWLIVTSAVFFLFYNYDNIFKVEQTPMATLVEKKGGVQVRYQELNIWNTAQSGQAFYRNEIVATGENSEALITFDGVSILKLDSNSQLLIQEKSDSIETPVLVTLFRGKVSTLNEKDTAEKLKTAEASGSLAKLKKAAEENKEKAKDEAKTAKLAIKSGDQTISIEAQSTKLSISKDVASDKASIAVEKGDIQITDATGSTTTIKDDAEDRRKLIPDEYLHPKDKLIPVLTLPVKGTTYWTNQELKSSYFTVRMNNTQNFISENQWLPIIRLGLISFENFPFAQKESHSELNIPVAKLTDKAQHSMTYGYDTYELKAFSGYYLDPKLDPQNITKPFFATEDTSFTLASFRTLPDGPLQILLKSFSSEPVQDKGWVKQNKLENEESAIQIELSTSTDLVLLASYLNGSQGFSIKIGQINKLQEGVFVVKNFESIMAINSQVPSNSAADVRRKLNADFVYKGKKEDLIKIKKLEDISDIDDVMDEQGLYVLSNSKVVRINKSLLKLKRSTINRFLQNKAQGFFKKKVTILDARNS